MVTNVNNTFERIASLLVQGEQINEANLASFGIGELNNNSERLLVLLAAVIQNLPAKVIPNVSTFSELPAGYRGLAIVADDPATADNSNVYLIDDGLQIPLINADKCTDANIRNLPERLVKAQQTFWMTDAGMEGFWRYNPSLNDSNCSDNTGIYRKTVWGGYLERLGDIYSSHFLGEIDDLEIDKITINVPTNLNGTLIVKNQIQVLSEINGGTVILINNNIKPDYAKINSKIIECSRTNDFDTATIYLDCVFGNDINSGLTQDAPKKTLLGARDLILNKCTTATEDVTVVLRGGRYELSATLYLNFAQINSNQSKIVFKANSGENVEITSDIRHFNLTDNNRFGDWYRIEKPDTEQYFQLVEFQTDEAINIANSDYCVNNTELLYSSNPITIVTKSGIQYAKIIVDNSTKTFLDSYAKEEVEQWFITVPQWFTAQIAKINEYNSSESYILYEIEQNLSEVYWNGYKYFNSTAKIPFWLYGKIVNKSQDNAFWTDNNFLYVKKKGQYITASPAVQEGIKSSSTGKIAFDNISVKYFTDSYSNIRKNNFTNVTNRQSVITLLNQTQSELLGLEFKHCMQNTVLLYSQQDYLVYNCLFTELGESGIVAYGTGNISLCEYDNLSNLSPHRGAVYTDINSTIKLNKFKNIGYTAIRFVLQPELLQTHSICNNDIQDIGYSQEKKAKVMDGAAIYGYGSNINGTFTNCDINENRIRKVKSDLYHRGIFLDDGVKNVNIFDNVIFETDFYAIDIRQVNNISDTNNVYNNICQKAIRLEALSVNSSAQYNNVVLETDLQNKFLNTTTSITKKIAYSLTEDKIKCKISDLPFIPKSYILEWITDENINLNLKTLNTENINVSATASSTLTSGGVTANTEDYNLTAASSGDRLVGKRIFAVFVEGALANVKKYVYEFLGTVAFTGKDNITSFLGKAQLAIKILGSKNSNDLSGIDFSGYTTNGNGNENPTGRIAVLTTTNGSFLIFGTSNNYSNGITNEALSIDPVGNIGIGGKTDYTKSIGLQIFTKKAFALPRLSTSERDSLSNLISGCEIYNTTINKKQLFNGTSWETITSA